MLDLETMGDSFEAPIVSIGAVTYDPKGEDTIEAIQSNPNRIFYRVVDLRTQTKGFSFSPRTLYWWLKQPKETREEILPKKEQDRSVVPIKEGLISFRDWYKSLGEPINTYAFGATFDHVVLQHAYRVFRIANPIPFQKQLCMRTLATRAGIACPSVPGLSHRSIDDAMRNVLWIQAINKL